MNWPCAVNLRSVLSDFLRPRYDSGGMSRDILSGMAISEEQYLLEFWDKNICPNCGNSIQDGKRYGSGRKADGGFCSLDCYAEYHKATLVERHKKRLAAAARHRNQ